MVSKRNYVLKARYLPDVQCQHFNATDCSELSRVVKTQVSSGVPVPWNAEPGGCLNILVILLMLGS